MKRIRVADTFLLVGDSVADLITEYAVLLSRVNTADRVTLNAIDDGGDLVSATVVLTQATTIVAETTNSPIPDPENGEAEEYIRGRLASWDAGVTNN
ncbi:hypothetical protein [Naasia aerilata]|uniref:Uncharacterized protein n=1 Tax=Naasia aerilata TaxID=1162966 RepID=A0ABM8GCH8_9MICO|nr:hypothetical protein [Naasia aerilata]BDZ45951.1 hypothetical protein GCM10025866_18600 [Naasia aerilata]